MPQRRWQAPCPGCGAAVEFQSPTSPVAVCTFCRSTVVREGDALRKIGVSSELIQDRTPLQLGARGRHNGVAFTLVGRLQYGYGEKVEGTWSEWHAVFDDGSHGWLSEDNDQYVFAFEVESVAYLPEFGQLPIGQQVRIGGMQWSVASLVDAKLIAAAGELPAVPPLGQVYPIADLRSALNRVATLDYADRKRPRYSVGQPVRLEALGLTVGASASEEDAARVGGRQFSCPGCGAPVSVNLAGTQSITCGSCNSLIDISQGIGADLKAVAQTRLMGPRIPLGSSATLTIGDVRAKSWTIVGFATKTGNFDDPEESFRWSEYLLYNREEGFAFLTDTVDGWVCFRTMTGTPEIDPTQKSIVGWQGGKFRLSDSYDARVDYVEGEYYWKVDKDQTFACEDYEGLGQKYKDRLSTETTGNEVVWSWGATLPASVIASAFGVSLPATLALGDVGPSSGSEEMSAAQVIMVVIFMIFVGLASMCSCDDDDGNCSSGSHSSSGFHK